MMPAELIASNAGNIATSMYKVLKKWERDYTSIIVPLCTPVAILDVNSRNQVAPIDESVLVDRHLSEATSVGWGTARRQHPQNK